MVLHAAIAEALQHLRDLLLLGQRECGIEKSGDRSSQKPDANQPIYQRDEANNQRIGTT